jgi:DNA-binding transcriptional MerR regulator
MEHVTIGQAAELFGMRSSALRYYDERGLVRPSTRRGGRRMYGPDELRRLAFVRIAQRLGLPLDTAAAVLDEPGPQWRDTVRRQIESLEEVIAQARGAQRFLSHALQCPADHPARDCPVMVGTLDRLVEGQTVEQLVAEHRSDRGDERAAGGTPPGTHAVSAGRSPASEPSRSRS